MKIISSGSFTYISLLLGTYVNPLTRHLNSLTHPPTHQPDIYICWIVADSSAWSSLQTADFYWKFYFSLTRSPGDEKLTISINATSSKTIPLVVVVVLLLWQSLWSSAWRLIKLTFVYKISLPAHLWGILNGSRDQYCSNKCWRNLNPLSSVGCRVFFFSNFVL